MLIRRAHLLDNRVVDIRVAETITGVAPRLEPQSGEAEFDARGCTVIPGLHDHHVHLFAAAAAIGSQPVGPDRVSSRADLRGALAEAVVGEDGWIRAVGYHDAAAGPLNRVALDHLRSDVPLRVQHRSGVLWFVNSAGLDALGLVDHPDGVVRGDDEVWSGALARRTVPLAALSDELTGFGVTGVTDATPDPGDDMRRTVDEARRAGEFRQRVTWLAPGKRILHDDALDLQSLVTWIADRHSRGSTVALHCVTAGQLVVAVAALREAGVRDGDRIEHAAVVPLDMISELAGLNVVVVTQPNFIAERGDQYRHDVEPDEFDALWRLASLLKDDVRVAISTDFPFGSADPWLSMRAAVTRSTPTGHILGPAERVSAQQALMMFLGTAERPDVPRTVAEGQPGHLCIMRGEPRDILEELDSAMVVGTVIDGVLHR